MKSLTHCTCFVTLICVMTAWSVRAGDDLVLLSPHYSGIKDEFTEAFEAHYRDQTGRTVVLKWLDVGGGTSDILRYIKTNFKNKPEGIGIDVFFGGGTDPYLELKRLGLLAPYRVPETLLKEIAPEINGIPLYDTDDFTWYAATMAGFGIIYNKEVLRRLDLPEPKTWEDLGRPELRTWVGSGDPRKSGATHMVYEIILQAYGWERGWRVITALGANVRAFASGSMQPTTDTAAGEVACALAIDFYAWAQVREVGERYIGYVMPRDLTVVNGDAIGILKGAPNRKVAETFINFVLSEAGQKLWMLRKGDPEGPRRHELGRFSVRPSLYPKIRGRTSVTLNPFEWKSGFVYDPALGGARWGLVNDLIGTQIIDPHERLAAAWRRADAELARLAALPITEEQARLLVRKVSADEARRLPGNLTEEDAARLAGQVPWRDKLYRSRLLSQWGSFAREKYGAPSALAPYLRNLPAALALLAGVVMIVYIRRRSRP